VEKLGLSFDLLNPFSKPYEKLQLKDGSKVVIIGGGPAGSFLAINLLRKAKRFGRKIEVIIMEKKKAINISEQKGSECYIGECNYCAGVLSPKICEALKNLGLILPSDVIMDKAFIINIFADWKTISLEVLREMTSVYRGSRPRGRDDSIYNFDSFLLESTVKEGARIITTEVTGLGYSKDGRVVVNYNGNSQIMESDFVAFAGGVNGVVGNKFDAEEQPVSYLHRIMPGFQPPKIRRAIIFELNAGENDRFMHKINGELYYILHGSRSLKLEMISIAPKGKYITVVLIGPSIDNSTNKDNLRIINEFMSLPNIRKILPQGAKLRNICICRPNMVTGAAKNPYGDRIAVVGDMLTANLYKDGIGSAYELSTKLAEVVLTRGIDKRSLKKGYGPVIKKYQTNNALGKLVFLFIRIFFSNSLYSRIIYQAVITERKTKAREKRRLENILWNTASGEGSYKNIILTMFHPLVIWSIISGGLLVTLRNYITELFFGLKWGNFTRITTGVEKEVFESKTDSIKEEFSGNLGEGYLDFERMYTIRISAPGEKIFKELGKFGDKDRKYFKPRFIDVRRISGEANQPGSIIRYNICPKLLSFSLRLLKAIPGEHISYEIMDGIGRGGILFFEIDVLKKGNEVIDGEYMLSIYVGFNFSKRILKRLFPAFMHDVVWNYSLCQLKDVIEQCVYSKNDTLA
jgi:flavin-dependent dehydrogenase